MKSGLGLVLILAVSLGACNKAPEAKPEELYTVDRAAAPAPVNFLHKTCKVPSYARFEFDVPAHSLSPKLQGTFKGFASGNPDQPAGMDLLVFTPEQFTDFTKDQGEATYTISASQTVDYALPPTIEQRQKYYLVFRNPAKGSARSVEADFTALF